MEKSQVDSTSEKKENIGKVALVHDFLLYRGGAERVLRALADMFPKAPIYTLLYDREGMKGMFDDREVRSSFLGSWPRFLRNRRRFLLPFYPVAAEAFDLRDFDTVISSSGAWTKGIVTRLRTKHIAYLHSPMRFVWDENESYLRTGGGFHFFKRLLLSYVRLWDREAAQRPDILVANSLYTRARVEKYYRRSCEVVYPPVRDGASSLSKLDVKKEQKDKPFVTVSRLSKYKRVDVIIRAFLELGLPLSVVGTGREFLSLRKLIPVGSSIHLLGDISDTELSNVLSDARAFVFAGEEDFGLSMAEAQRVGIPVIALSAGGAREIVEDGQTGILFPEPNVSTIVPAVRKYLDRESTFDCERIRKYAERFSEGVFREKMVEIIEKAVSGK